VAAAHVLGGVVDQRGRAPLPEHSRRTDGRGHQPATAFGEIPELMGLAGHGAHTFCDCTRADETIAAHTIMQACFSGQ
jgi:hypothetical protein